MSQIVWFDEDGLGILTNGKPEPATRFGNWTPRRRPIGPSAVAVGTGVTHRFEFRRDDTVSFEIAHVPASSMELMNRLEYHLLNGGSVQIETDRVLGSQFTTSILAPGTEPSIEFTDRQLGEYTFSVTLKGLGGESDGFLFPGFVPEVQLWLPASNQVGIKEHEDFMGGWQDESGNDNHMVTTASGGDQPRWVENALPNGQSAVWFDGVDNFLVSPSIQIPTVSPGSFILWASKRISSANPRSCIFAFGTGDLAGSYSDESMVYEHNTSPGDISWYQKQSGGDAEIASGTATDPTIYGLEFVSASLVRPFVNGVAGTTFAVYNQIESSMRDGIRMGRLPNPLLPGETPWAMPMHMYEFIWVNGVPSGSVRNGLTRYLGLKLDIDVSV